MRHLVDGLHQERAHRHRAQHADLEALGARRGELADRDGRARRRRREQHVVALEPRGDLARRAPHGVDGGDVVLRRHRARDRVQEPRLGLDIAALRRATARRAAVARSADTPAATTSKYARTISSIDGGVASSTWWPSASSTARGVGDRGDAVGVDSSPGYGAARRRPMRSRPGSTPTSSGTGARAAARVGIAGDRPAIASRIAAVSRTLRVSTCSSGAPPELADRRARAVRPRDGFSPTSPHTRPGCGSSHRRRCACATGTMPAATAAAAPPLDPPVERVGVPRVAGRADAIGSVVAGEPNSGVFVLPTMTSPAARKRRTRCVSAAPPAERLEHGMPRWYGSPAACATVLEQERHAGERPAGSGPAATARASNSGVTTALSTGFAASMRAIAASTSSAGVTSPRARVRPARWRRSRCEVVGHARMLAGQRPARGAPPRDGQPALRNARARVAGSSPAAGRGRRVCAEAAAEPERRPQPGARASRRGRVGRRAASVPGRAAAAAARRSGSGRGDARRLGWAGHGPQVAELPVRAAASAARRGAGTGRRRSTPTPRRGGRARRCGAGRRR